MRSIVFLTALFVSSVCHAGVEQKFVCRHCGLRGTYVQGALLTADQFVAFCPQDHFVHISWDYHKSAPKPVRFARESACLHLSSVQETHGAPMGRERVSQMWQQRDFNSADRNGRRLMNTCNQSLQRTAGRSGAPRKIMKTSPLQSTLALAIGR